MFKHIVYLINLQILVVKRTSWLSQTTKIKYVKLILQWDILCIFLADTFKPQKNLQEIIWHKNFTTIVFTYSHY